MNPEDRFDSLIQFHVERLWPGLDWLVVKAMVAVESAFKPKAESRCGARGLLQLMPATDREIDGDIDGFEIEGNLDNGIRYLKRLYSLNLLSGIAGKERLKFVLAGYNGGIGYVYKAMVLARGNGQPTDVWDVVAPYLRSRDCTSLEGKHPDWRQIIDYVRKVFKKWEGYKA